MMKCSPFFKDGPISSPEPGQSRYDSAPKRELSLLNRVVQGHGMVARGTEIREREKSGPKFEDKRLSTPIGKSNQWSQREKHLYHSEGRFIFSCKKQEQVDTWVSEIREACRLLN
jgi:hypothetical protein